MISYIEFEHIVLYIFVNGVQEVSSKDRWLFHSFINDHKKFIL